MYVPLTTSTSSISTLQGHTAHKIIVFILYSQVLWVLFLLWLMFWTRCCRNRKIISYPEFSEAHLKDPIFHLCPYLCSWATCITCLSISVITVLTAQIKVGGQFELVVTESSSQGHLILGVWACKVTMSKPCCQEYVVEGIHFMMGREQKQRMTGLVTRSKP